MVLIWFHMNGALTLISLSIQIAHFFSHRKHRSTFRAMSLKSPWRSCVHTVTVHEVLDDVFLDHVLFYSIWSNLWHLHKLMPISSGIGELTDHSNYRELVAQSILFQEQLNSWQFLWLYLPRYQKNNQRLWILSTSNFCLLVRKRFQTKIQGTQLCFLSLIPNLTAPREFDTCA